MESSHGGIGRHEGLKIPWAEGPVRIRLPLRGQYLPVLYWEVLYEIMVEDHLNTKRLYKFRILK